MTLEELQAEVEKLNKLIAEKDAIIQQQNVQIENMLQAILHARKERFGAKSEATLPGQFSCRIAYNNLLNLFDISKLISPIKK